MNALVQLLQRRLMTDLAAARIGQMACFATALVVLVIAVRKLAALPLSEGQLIIGLLSALACTLLMIVMGLVLPLAVRANKSV